jgi:hypothetical protein
MLCAVRECVLAGEKRRDDLVSSSLREQAQQRADHGNCNSVLAEKLKLLLLLHWANLYASKCL